MTVVYAHCLLGIYMKEDVAVYIGIFGMDLVCFGLTLAFWPGVDPNWMPQVTQLCSSGRDSNISG
jgi:hypothetical protein